MYRRLIALVALICLGSPLIPLGSVFAAGKTARAALTEVLAAAKKWQADALMVGLSSVTVKPDGTADDWKFSFYSPKAQKRSVVTADSSGVHVREVNLGYGTQAIGEFIDSDRAMQEAKKNGLKGNEPNMAVKFQGAGSAAVATWIVNGGTTKGDISVFLDARTGRFIGRSTMD